MAVAFYIVVLICCGISTFRWRWGVYLAVALDGVRDPVRKLAVEAPLLITLAPTAVWGAVFLGLLLEGRGRATAVWKNAPRTKTFVALLIASLAVGAVVAVTTLPNGLLVAAFGATAYAGPLIGLAVGYAFVETAADIRRLSTWYCVVNAAMLIGVPAEQLGLNWPGLGGIEMNWIRTFEGTVIPLISGFYRGPDVMGLRAAQLMMFAAALAISARELRESGSKTLPQWVWLLAIVWGGTCLVLCGRRKMIAIPFVFAAAAALLAGLREGWVRAASYTAAGVAIAVAGVALAADQSSLGVGNDDYLASTWSGLPERLSKETVTTIEMALRQYGIFGNGLGSATQGHYYIAGRRLTWPESMGGRVVTELGVPGAVLLAAALLALLGSFKASLPRRGEFAPHVRLQMCMLAMLIAAAASMTISHQSFSGDPMEMLFLFALSGFVLRLRLSQFVPNGRPLRRFGAPAYVSVGTARGPLRPIERHVH